MRINNENRLSEGLWMKEHNLLNTSITLEASPWAHSEVCLLYIFLYIVFLNDSAALFFICYTCLLDQQINFAYQTAWQGKKITRLVAMTKSCPPKFWLGYIWGNRESISSHWCVSVGCVGGIAWLGGYGVASPSPWVIIPALGGLWRLAEWRTGPAEARIHNTTCWEDCGPFF